MKYTLFSLLLAVSGAAAEAPEPRISQEYVEANRGTRQYLTTEGYELSNIILALTPLGLRDERLFSHNDYYREVIGHFLPHKNHAVVKALNIVEENVGWFLYFSSASSKAGAAGGHDHLAREAISRAFELRQLLDHFFAISERRRES